MAGPADGALCRPVARLWADAANSFRGNSVVLASVEQITKKLNLFEIYYRPP